MNLPASNKSTFLVVAFFVFSVGFAWSQISKTVGSSSLSATEVSAVETPKPNADNKPAPLATPTEADRQLGQRLAGLIKELDQPSGIARELINSFRDRELEWHFVALQSTTPVSSRALSRARRFAQGMLPQLEAAQKLSLPKPQPVTALTGTMSVDG